MYQKNNSKEADKESESQASSTVCPTAATITTAANCWPFRPSASVLARSFSVPKMLTIVRLLLLLLPPLTVRRWHTTSVMMRRGLLNETR